MRNQQKSNVVAPHKSMEMFHVGVLADRLDFQRRPSSVGTLWRRSGLSQLVLFTKGCTFFLPTAWHVDGDIFTVIAWLASDSLCKLVALQRTLYLLFCIHSKPERSTAYSSVNERSTVYSSVNPLPLALCLAVLYLAVETYRSVEADHR